MPITTRRLATFVQTTPGKVAQIFGRLNKLDDGGTAKDIAHYISLSTGLRDMEGDSETAAFAVVEAATDQAQTITHQWMSGQLEGLAECRQAILVLLRERPMQVEHICYQTGFSVAV